QRRELLFPARGHPDRSRILRAAVSLAAARAREEIRADRPSAARVGEEDGAAARRRRAPHGRTPAGVPSRLYRWLDCRVLPAHPRDDRCGDAVQTVRKTARERLEFAYG